MIKSARAWEPCVQAPDVGTKCEELYASSYANVHYRFEDVFFTDANHGWAVGKRSFKPGLTGQTIFHTDDGGASWSEQFQSAPPLDRSWSIFRLDDVFFADAAHGWAVGRPEIFSDFLDHGAILHTSDGGLHWAEQGRELASGLTEFFAAHFLDAQNGWALDTGHTDPALGSSALYLARTSDGGATWQWVSTGIPGGLAIGFALVQGGLTFTDPQHGWAVGGLGTIVHTGDGGATWTQQKLPDIYAYSHLNGVAFIDDRVGWIAGEGLWATTDGGASWSSKSVSRAGDLADVTFPDSLHGWLAGDGGTVLRTSDGGATWTRLESGTGAALRGVSFVSAQKGWFVGDRGTILKTVP